MGAIELIVEERARQRRLGYDEKHDDGHGDGSLLVAGLLIGNGVADLCLSESHAPAQDGPWPDQLFFKVQEKYKGDDTQQLVIAAALLSAEIDRRLRSAK